MKDREREGDEREKGEEREEERRERGREEREIGSKIFIRKNNLK